MVEAREPIYRLSARELKDMAFALAEIGLRTYPGFRILEVGTGPGHFTRWMAGVSAPGPMIYVFDDSWPTFAKAWANTGVQPGITLLRAKATGRLPFREESVDLVFLRLARLGERGMSDIQASFQLLRPGGWPFKAGWNLRRKDSPWTEGAIQQVFESAEVHEWQYPRLRTRDEYLARLIEHERAICYGEPPSVGPVQLDGGVILVTITCENLRIARKPLR